MSHIKFFIYDEIHLLSLVKNIESSRKIEKELEYVLRLVFMLPYVYSKGWNTL